ncbi:MAG: TolC family protein, partial [Gammaproteobacteria bacterium]|nr:TolC family protein [Gammaproteobacteria bacterium]
IGLLLASTSAAKATSQQEPIADAANITADQLASWVLARNPGVVELTAAAEVARLRVEPAGSLDDPTLGYTFAPRTFGRAGQGLNQKIEFSQRLPWPGTLAAREAAAEHEATMARKDLATLRLWLAATAQSAYAEWFFVHRALEIHHEADALLSELKTVAETRYAAGRALQQDVLQAELEQAQLDRRYLQLKRVESSVQAHINALLNRDPTAPLPSPSGVTTPKVIPTLADLESYALATHPELKRLTAKIAAHTAHVTVAEKAFYPDVRFTAGYNSLWDEADKRPVVGLSVNVPLDRRKRRAVLNGAKAEVRRAQSQRENRRAQLLGDLARTHAEVRESVDAVSLYETSLLPLAKEYLEAAVADYQSGAGSFLAVITAEQQKLTTEEAHARNRANVVRHLAELDRWTGKPPSREGSLGERP